MGEVPLIILLPLPAPPPKLEAGPNTNDKIKYNNCLIIIPGQRTSRQATVEDSGFLSNHNCTSTSLGSRINCTNSSSSQIAKSPVHNSLRKNYQSSGGISGISGNLSGNFSGNSYQKSISTSPITVTTMSDGRVERRLETCSYQEPEMVRLNRIIKLFS